MVAVLQTLGQNWVFMFTSVCATTAAASCTGCRDSDQSSLLEAGTPLRVVWSLLGLHSIHSRVPASSLWWHQQLLLPLACLHREKGLRGSVSRVTGFPRALPWCGAAGEAAGLVPLKLLLFGQVPPAAVVHTDTSCDHVDILSLCQSSSGSLDVEPSRLGQWLAA